MKYLNHRFSVATGFFAIVAMVAGEQASAQPKKTETFGTRELQFFESKIRPMLVEHCYSCHSTEAGKAEGNLLVDSRRTFSKGVIAVRRSLSATRDAAF